jgi:phytanoyl-CoA hydroxylase
MLTDDQVAQYHVDGFTISRGFLSPGEVAELLWEIEAISAGNTLAAHDRSRLEMEPAQGPDGTLVRRIYEPCTHYPRFRALSEDARLVESVARLLGPNVLFHYSKINMKPPAIGSVVEWHQDLTYYPLTNRDSLAVLFYLDGADRENGCLQVLPGRHLGAPIEHTRNGWFQGKVTEALDTSDAVPLEAGAGSAIFMHGMTPHASVTNTSDRPRRTLILSYRAADAYPIYVGEPTAKTEQHVRLVRGEWSPVARFGEVAFPIPRHQRATASLYELQELSRQEEA